MTRFRPVLVTAPAAELYTDAEIKLHLHIDESEADWDSMITMLKAVATARLDGWKGVLGRCLINQTWRQDFAGWSQCLRLPFPDVSSVVLTYRDSSNAEQALSSDAYEVLEDSLGAYLEFQSSYTPPNLYDRAAPVSASFVAGYGAAASAVPADIRIAGLLLMGHLFANREAVNIGNITSVLPLGFDALIENHRRVGV